MAKVTIGGEEHEVPPLNFKGIKKVWPMVSKMAAKTANSDTLTTEDGLEAVDVAIAVVAASFERHNPEKNADWIEENLHGSEVAGLQMAMQDIMIESGVMEKSESPSGEAPTPTEEASTGTGTE